jgi:hypothetical protein
MCHAASQSPFILLRRVKVIMAGNDILQEARKLYSVSNSLDMLAQQNEPVAEALFILAKTVRESATLLEVMVAVKLSPENHVEKASN